VKGYCYSKLRFFRATKLDMASGLMEFVKPSSFQSSDDQTGGDARKSRHELKSDFNSFSKCADFAKQPFFFKNCFQITADRVFGHFPGFFKRFAFGYKTGQLRHSCGVSIAVWLKSYFVLENYFFMLLYHLFMIIYLVCLSNFGINKIRKLPRNSSKKSKKRQRPDHFFD